LARPSDPRGPITSGNGRGRRHLPTTGYDPVQARSLLASIGMTDRDRDGLLEDAAGKPVRFAVVTQKGDTIKERTVSIIKEQLRQAGLSVDIVPMERNPLRALLGTGDYDAVYFNAQSDAFDPARNLDYWLSSGAFHFWNPGQAKPATAWEARIDELMEQQTSTLDLAERQRLFAEVQRTLPRISQFVFRRLEAIVAMNARVTGATPAVLNPPTLWNAEVISIAAPVRR
jgi:peptide/nickel transport system substrate-binding protein